MVFELAANYPSRVRTASIGGAHPYAEDLSALRGFSPEAILNMWQSLNAPLSENSKRRLTAFDPQVLIDHRSRQGGSVEPVGKPASALSPDLRNNRLALRGNATIRQRERRLRVRGSRRSGSSPDFPSCGSSAAAGARLYSISQDRNSWLNALADRPRFAAIAAAARRPKRRVVGQTHARVTFGSTAVYYPARSTHRGNERNSPSAA